MKSIQWISASMLLGGTGLLSWVVWTQDLMTVWQGTLALWFVWYAIQSVLAVPTRIQWQLRLVTTTGLLLGVLWQNGMDGHYRTLWSLTLSNKSSPMGTRSIELGHPIIIVAAIC